MHRRELAGGNRPCRLPGRIPRDDRRAYRLPLANREVGVACVSLLMQTNEATYHTMSIDRLKLCQCSCQITSASLGQQVRFEAPVPSLLLWQHFKSNMSASNPKSDFVEIISSTECETVYCVLDPVLVICIAFFLS